MGYHVLRNSSLWWTRAPLAALSGRLGQPFPGTAVVSGLWAPEPAVRTRRDIALQMWGRYLKLKMTNVFMGISSSRGKMQTDLDYILNPIPEASQGLCVFYS